MSTDITSIAHVIQLAVAPVFLFSGIAALLNVLNKRLSRIVDRARQLQNEFPSAAPRRTERGLRERDQHAARHSSTEVQHGSAGGYNRPVGVA